MKCPKCGARVKVTPFEDESAMGGGFHITETYSCSECGWSDWSSW